MHWLVAPRGDIHHSMENPSISMRFREKRRISRSRTLWICDKGDCLIFWQSWVARFLCMDAQLICKSGELPQVLAVA